MRIRRLFLIITVVALAATSAFAQVNGMYGRQIAADGTVDTFRGTLGLDGNEWILNVGSIAYNLHLGRYGHEPDLALNDGASAVVEGFVMERGIAPVSILTEGEELAFWHEDGYPLWAGRGNRTEGFSQAPDGGRGMAFAAREPEPRTRGEVEQRESQLRDRGRQMPPSRGRPMPPSQGRS